MIGDHVFDGGAVGGGVAYAGLEPGAAARFDDEPAQPLPGRAEHPRVAGQLGQGDRGRLGQPVRAGQHHPDRLPVQHDRAQSVQRQRGRLEVVDLGGVPLAGPDLRDAAFGQLHRHVEVRRREESPQRAEDPGQRRRLRAEAERRRAAAGHHPVHLRQVEHHPLGEGQQSTARLGEADHPGGAFEQRQPEMPFEPLDVGRHRRLREPEEEGSPAEALRSGHRQEHSQLSDLQFQPVASVRPRAPPRADGSSPPPTPT
ncbi:hypothetical protein MRQ36_03015 [Micromonospora sp. R77]|nr:hypothetical protein [Micromonospora sp. R77]MCI4061598.1 hypothetical protein [Micromonospora sp. R77]